ncbi:hypothetical protein ACLKA6_004535 [Drosophila palustris]
MKKGFLKSAWTKTGAVRVGSLQCMAAGRMTTVPIRSPAWPETEDNVGLSRVRFLQSAVSDAVAGSTCPAQTRHHPRPARQEQSQTPSRSQSRGSTTRPKIGRLAPAAVLTIEAYGCTGHSSSSTNSRHPRPSKLTDAPVSSNPLILRPATSTSANTRGSVLSSRWTASMI